MEFSKFTRPKITLRLCILILLITFSGATPLYAKKTAQAFPSYAKIRNNVIFWDKIYSIHSTKDAIVHDKNDLSKVYTVLHLYDRRIPGGSKINRAILKKAKKKYSRILRKLAKGGIPATKDEKRIAALFKGSSAKKQMRKAAEGIRVQMGMKERFEEGYRRSGKYITKIKRILRSYNLPTDLAYLPHVESSFNVEAYSKFGAAGIWQFTRSTGKEFLTINYIIDERRDPILATHAAAKFLKRNYELLGTWPLAITAYNYGPSGMKRALKSKGNYENIFTSYRQGYFKFAARNFYSEFIAAKNVAKRLERNPRIKQDPTLSTHSRKLRGYVHINHISNHFRISTVALKQLNPSLRSPIFKGEKYIPKGYSLKVPAGAKNRRLLAALPSSIFQDHQKRSQYYRVRKGDTAGSIARTHKTSLRELSRTNNLNASAMVYIGQKLRLPTTASTVSQAQPLLVISSSSKQKINAKAEGLQKLFQLPVLSDVRKHPPSHTFTPQSPHLAMSHLTVSTHKSRNGISFGKITVQPEESLAIYAEWLKTSRQHLRKLNNLRNGATIHPEQKITIAFDKVTQAEFEDKRLDYHQETEKNFYTTFQIIGLKKYKVSPGDTLWDLCYNKFDLPYWLLRKYNSEINFNKLAANQKLTIPIIVAL